MVESDILLSFLEISRVQPGLKCPKCGTAYLTEDTVIEVIRKGEEAIQAKF